MLSFVGGCIGCVGYIYLFHSLLGVMTANTMIGLIEILQGDLHHAIFHILFVCGFLVAVAIHKTYAAVSGEHGSHKITKYLILEVLIILLCCALGTYALSHGQLREPNPLALLITVIGSVAVYLQNYVVMHGYPVPTNTSFMTGNYVSWVGSVVSLMVQRSENAKKEVIHFTAVHVCFGFGVICSAILSKWLDFFTLLVPCALICTYIVARYRHLNKAA
jgi:uncharacterized membrane protein YoaK (UPF0700 family)